MTIMLFDTLNLNERLKEGVFTPQQARTLTEAPTDVTIDERATKADLKLLGAQLKQDVNQRFARIETDIM